MEKFRFAPVNLEKNTGTSNEKLPEINSEELDDICSLGVKERC